MKPDLSALWETLFPRTCPVCRRSLQPQETDMCLLCERDLPLTHFWDWRNNPAEKKLWGRIPLRAVYALFYFDRSNDYPQLLYRIKYQGGRKLAKALGRRLGTQLQPLAATAGWSGIIPVPLHWRKRWQRGYNQSEWIAEGIAQVLQLPVYPQALIRQRYTRTQTRLLTEEKWANLQGAFRLNPNQLPQGEQHWLLVDDVLTTGATLEACASILVEQLGCKVSIATLAYVE